MSGKAGKIGHIKDALKSQKAFSNIWTGYRCRQLHVAYEKRRDHYAKLAQELGLVYHETEVAKSVRCRLTQRGYTPSVRALGEIHTFAVIPLISWHSALLPDLNELGALTVFDYEALGFTWSEFAKADRVGLERRKQMNEVLLATLKKVHAERPVDFVFVYANGLEISSLTLKRISEEIGIPTVNMCMDDKQSWTGQWMGDHNAGQVGIASAFDLSWTTARVACEWYLAEGGRPIYMPGGFDNATYHPSQIKKDLPVSFMGESYGFRTDVIRYLRKNGVDVHTFGKGWPGAAWVESVADVFNRSLINLGLGGIGYSESLTNIKGRDFDVPGTGGGMYLTSFNPDLALHYRIGKEIICYRNRDEMLELIRYYLARPEEAKEIARCGRERCLAEHRWLHRYKRICEVLGILAENE